MALGDIYVVTAADPADNASLTITPAAGQEVMLKFLVWGVGSTDLPGNEVYNINPGGTDLFMNGDGYPELDYPMGFYKFPEPGFLITNTHSLALKNTSGGARTFHSAVGIEIEPAT